MICPFCKAKTDGVNHNNRGLRCTACWYPLPTAGDRPAREAFDTGVVSDAIRDRLIEADYTVPDDIWEASDKALLAIRGIGETTLAELRAAYGG